MGAIERLDELLRVHHLARPGIVHIDEVPHIGFPGAQPVDHRWIIGEGFSLDRRFLLLPERVENLRRIIALPAQDVQFFLSRCPADARQAGCASGECCSPQRRLLHEVPARKFGVTHLFLPER